ncbi:TetR/AcrR family transcriptional regulator [Thalassotalea sp. M1531]|uniref:TetR/AcrR family transcriptional regulator n=1 Tax=Thalassotalea algicola TaxID=2716224 RepID=A0A7Y0LBI0_9GAMM|nr:TetR/AcrR family transcriptional regulator [Thalassotalea algicola]NMP31500.1 TetR/AcrR family transcriptional regulator [Thalassotalea algicola]
MPKSVEKIIAAAQECFFQHGFSASNVSLIGRYADISRATIYKNFSSKEAIFRAVVQNHIDENKAGLITYAASESDFWQDTENLITERCKGLFDEISSNLIRSELIHAGQSQCHDILIKEKEEIQLVIFNRLEKEVSLNRISMENIELTTRQFAQVIEAIPFGVAVSSMEENNLALIHHMFSVFRASTKL